MEKTLIIVVLLSTLIFTNVQASPGWHASDKVWDVCYFGGAGYLTILLHNVCGIEYGKSYTLTVGAAILKEIGDEIYKATSDTEHCFFDKRGGNAWDVLKAGASITITFPIYKAEQKRREEDEKIKRLAKNYIIRHMKKERFTKNTLTD